MQLGSWKVLKSIPKIQSYEISLELMTKEQLDLNMIEINLVALHNTNIMKWLINSMVQYSFYLQYRYYMTNLLNAKITETNKQEISIFTSKCDEKFVNGLDQYQEENQNNLNKSKSKGYRLDQMIIIEQFNDLLVKIAAELFKIDDDQAKMQHFKSQLAMFNSSLLLKIQENDEDNQNITEDNMKIKEKGISIFWKDKIQKIKHINIENSFYIKTKNRIPLILDLNFARFMYKNDDQLSHQLIAMELIKYINAILGKEYIIPYQIIPLKCGAFYQFVENSYTINSIKKEESYKGSLLTYYQKLCDQFSSQIIKNKFTESYSGFCLIQYLLDIKDRNNANIMIRNDGSIFHIDLAFIFGSGPGGISFESAPFKMTKQYVKLLQGFQSDYFKKFQALLVQHFTKLNENRQQLEWKINVLSRRSKQIKCFQSFNFKDFCKKIPTKLQRVKGHVQDLIDKSYDSFKTNKYDDYQFKTNNIQK